MARKRKSGTGTIRQRKDGRWEGRAVVGYDDKGLPKTKNVLAKTKHECQEKLTKLMETVGSAKSEKICADMPFGEWMDFWYQNYVKPQIRPTTQANYEAKIYQHIIPELLQFLLALPFRFGQNVLCPGQALLVVADYHPALPAAVFPLADGALALFPPLTHGGHLLPACLSATVSGLSPGDFPESRPRCGWPPAAYPASHGCRCPG